MRITSLVENTSTVGFSVEHGLSLHIQMNDGRNVLFDMGQRRLFAENALKLGLSIENVDVAVISHGHYDHGGGLRAFLDINEKAKVYIHQDAFQPHYSLRENGLAYIGIEKELQGNERLTLCGPVTKVNESMTLFADVQGDCCLPLGNRLLFESFSHRGDQEGAANDKFTHEQNLIIEEGENVILFAGCAHNGIVNIIRKAEQVIGRTPSHVFGGMHLVKSGMNEADENAFISTLANELMSYKRTKFYTMHCTGAEQYNKLKSIMGSQIDYLSCGESVETK